MVQDHRLDAVDILARRVRAGRLEAASTHYLQAGPVQRGMDLLSQRGDPRQIVGENQDRLAALAGQAAHLVQHIQTEDVVLALKALQKLHSLLLRLHFTSLPDQADSPVRPISLEVAEKPDSGNLQALDPNDKCPSRIPAADHGWNWPASRLRMLLSRPGSHHRQPGHEKGDSRHGRDIP